MGKSRLVERFAERSGAPFLFYAATGAFPRDDLARPARDAQASTLPLAGLVAAARPESWDAAFDVLAAALPADRASVLVIGEVPYLMGTDGAFELLTDKRIVAAELPVSLRPSKDRRYRVTDPYLRFWLHLLGLSMEEIERGRGDLTLARIRENWTSWRGRAVEPLVREALAPILPDDRLPAAPAVGGYWTRTNDVEIDIVGADRAPIAKELLFVGSIKWLEQSPFDRHDAGEARELGSAIRLKRRWSSASTSSGMGGAGTHEAVAIWIG